MRRCPFRLSFYAVDPRGISWAIWGLPILAIATIPGGLERT